MIEMDDNGNTITMTDSKGKNTVTLDGSKGLILDSQGEISIKAMKDLNIEAANINMSTTSGKIEAKATTDLNLSGLKINEKATTDFNNMTTTRGNNDAFIATFIGHGNIMIFCIPGSKLVGIIKYQFIPISRL